MALSSKKVIFLNRFFYPDHSATSQMLSDLAFYLADNGLSISVICSDQSYDNSVERYPSHEEVKGVKVYRVRTTKFGRTWLPGRAFDYLTYFTGMLWKLINITGKGDVIICKTDPPLTSVLSLPIAKIKNAKHINWLQDLFPEVAESLGVKLIPNFLVKGLKVLRNATLKSSFSNVAIGENMRQRLLDLYIPGDKIQVIHNWANNDGIHPVDKYVNNLAQKGNLNNKFVVLYSGNMGRVHEFTTILQAASELNHIRDIVFLFIGNGPRKNMVKQFVDENKLNNVLFKPYQSYDQLSLSLSIGDVHLVSLIPSIEGFCVPSKFYGIIAVARPLIFVGDRNGEIAKIITGHQCGIQVAEGNYKGLSDAILAYYQDSSLWKFHSNNSYKLSTLLFKNSVSFQQWHELINRAINA